MVFILYKLYVLLPYTYPTPKLSPHRRRCISIFPQKNSLCMIYKHFKLWGHWKCPHKSPSPCNTCHTHVIIQICVLINHINMPTHTHTHTHTHSHLCTSVPAVGKKVGEEWTTKWMSVFMPFSTAPPPSCLKLLPCFFSFTSFRFSCSLSLTTFFCQSFIQSCGDSSACLSEHGTLGCAVGQEKTENREREIREGI